MAADDPIMAVLDAYERVTDEIAGLQRELGAVRQQVIEQRAHALAEPADNVTQLRLGAERASATAAAEQTVLEAEIAACQERKDYLKMRLDLTLWG